MWSHIDVAMELVRRNSQAVVIEAEHICADKQYFEALKKKMSCRRSVSATLSRGDMMLITASRRRKRIGRIRR